MSELLEDNLFPEDIDDMDEDFLDDEEEILSSYKQGLYFDTETGDLMLNGAGQLLIADGVTAWTTWCEKIISTPRYGCDLYSTDIGIDYDAVFAAADREEAESILESQIHEALAIDPYGRTQYVQNIECEWLAPDSIDVDITVVGMDNEIITINKVIKKS